MAPYPPPLHHLRQRINSSVKSFLCREILTAVKANFYICLNVLADMTNKAADEHAIASAAFSIRGLYKIYGTGETEVHALRRVNLDLEEGKLAVL